jgi:hypothetical protein
MTDLQLRSLLKLAVVGAAASPSTPFLQMAASSSSPSHPELGSGVRTLMGSVSHASCVFVRS